MSSKDKKKKPEDTGKKQEKKRSSAENSSKAKKEQLSAMSKPVSPEMKALLDRVSPVAQSSEAQIAFDAIANQFLSTALSPSHQQPDGAPTTDTQASEDSLSQVYFFDREGQHVKTVDLTSLFNSSTSEAIVRGDQQTKETGKQNPHSGIKTAQDLGDSLSILRFVRGNKSKRLEISPSGLSLKYLKASNSKEKKDDKQQEEELVLTNMAFSTGLHLWEIIAPICCNSIQIGVYNPVTKTEVLTSFKTTTPRVVTVCLDLNENMVKFWLNDRRNPGKNLKLPNGGSGPWVPCVKISTEKNRLILNPFAREPSDFYERDFDKRFTLRKYLMPHLFNTICIQSPAGKTSVEAPISKILSKLKELVKISSSEIRHVWMPSSEQSTDNFCFVQFNLVDAMTESINKLRENGYTVYTQDQIADWFEAAELSEETKLPYQVIRGNIPVPSSTMEKALLAMSTSFNQIVKDKAFNKGNSAIQNASNTLQLIQHPYSDRLLVKSRDSHLSVVARDDRSQAFEVAQALGGAVPSQLTSLVTLRVEEKVLATIFGKVNWSSLFKDNNALVNDLVESFFLGLAQTAIRMDDKYVTFRVPFNKAKLFVDICIQHIKSHIERSKRHYLNNQSVVPQSNPILAARVKPEIALESLLNANLPFLEDPNISADDLYLTLNIFCDLSEQIWAKAKSQGAPSEVRNFVNTVSRPFSAYNRLGSFVAWGASSGPESKAARLAEQGFFMRENLTVSHFENPSLELPDLSDGPGHLLDETYLRQHLGDSNRFLNALATENVPLSRTLNYFGPRNMNTPTKANKSNQAWDSVMEVIPSHNSDFYIVGNTKGCFSVCNASLNIPETRQFWFFEADKKSKYQSFADIMEQKVNVRIEMFDSYKSQLLQKSVPFAILGKKQKPSDSHPPATFEELKEQKKIIAQKVKAVVQAKGKQNMKITKAKAPKKMPNVDSKKAKPSKYPPIGGLKPINEQVQPLAGDGAEMQALFGEVPKSQREQLSEAGSSAVLLQSLKPLAFQECKVLGYILLSKPQSLNPIDPIIVGCLFYSAEADRYMLRIKRITYSIQYLQSFITLDSATGQRFNKISGKQLVTAEDVDSMNQEILNNRETIAELYQVFMRIQVMKDGWPRKDYKFAAFDDIAEAELSIEGCNRIVDFTRCSYSVNGSNKIFVLGNNTETSKLQLIEFTVTDGPMVQGSYIKPISIDRGKELDLESESERVFSVENRVILVGRERFQVLKQENFEPIVDEQLCTPIKDMKAVTVLNLSPQSQRYCKENAALLMDLKSVPQQDWHLVVNENVSDGHSYARYQLFEKVKDEVKTRGDKTLNNSGTEILLDSALASDIVQIGSLLESRQEGTIAIDNKHSVVNSSGIDTETGNALRHTWQILQDRDDEEKARSFQVVLGSPIENREVHLKELKFEFGFTKKTGSQITLSFGSTNGSQSLAARDSMSAPQRLPLTIELFTGASMNDTMHPNIITLPDADVFCSNYPQPEFIFKLQSNKPFLPTSFTIRSKENRVFNGIPISTGLIFAAESLEDLQNNKYFARMTEKELIAWQTERVKLTTVPYLPSEPISYFNMGEDTEIIIDVQSSHPVRYLKFIPTGFRKKPINFSSKSFNANQAEIQFFGVNGIELESEDSTNVLQLQTLEESIKVNLGAELKEDLKGFSLGSINEVSLRAIRGAKAQNYYTPITALSQLQIPNIIAVGSIDFGVKEEHCDKISSFTLTVPATAFKSESEWTLSSISISVHAYTDRSATFSPSSGLQDQKPRMRHYLLDPSHFSQLLGKLLSIAHSSETTSERRVAALQCIMNYLQNNSSSPNASEFERLIKEQTRVELLLNEQSFIDQSLKFQQTALAFLEKLSLLKQDGNEKYLEDFISKQIPKLSEKARPVQKVKHVIDMLSLCSKEVRQRFQATLIKDLLFKEVCFGLLPKYQTKEQVLLRSKLGLNHYPLDAVSSTLAESVSEDLTVHGTSTGSRILPFNMEVYKLGTLYHYDIDMTKHVEIQGLKLFFEKDELSSYKVQVKVFTPYSFQGGEQIVYQRVFDENYFSQVCDKAFKNEIVQYFKDGVRDQGEQKQLMNFIPVSLKGTYRYLRLQVELQDSFKSVHKTQSVTSIFIRPEFYGSGQISANNKQSQQQEGGFTLNDDMSTKIYLFSQEFSKGFTYTFYSMPEEAMCNSNKACYIKVTNNLDKDEAGKAQKQTEAKACSQEERKKVLQEIIDQQNKLKELVVEARQGFQIKVIQSKSLEIGKLKERLGASEEQAVGLGYLQSLADILAGSVLSVVKDNTNEVFKNEELKDYYAVLFQRFIAYDIKDNHPNVSLLADSIFEKITDRSRFLVSLAKQYLFHNDEAHLKGDGISNTHFSQKNVLVVIQSQKNLDFTEFVEALIESFGLSDAGNKIVSLTTEAHVNSLMEKLFEASIQKPSSAFPVQDLIITVSLLEDLCSGNLPHMDKAFTLLVNLAVRTPQVFSLVSQKEKSNKNGLVAFKYMLQTLNKLATSKSKEAVEGLGRVVSSCLKEVATLAIIAVQHNDKDIDKNVKEILASLSKVDTEARLSATIYAILTWFKNKDNISSASFFKHLDKSKSVGLYYKHMSLFFEVYMELLQSGKKRQEQGIIEEDYKELGSIVDDLLKVLVQEQDSPNYELTFFEVWLQIFTTIVYLVTHGLMGDLNLVDLFVEKFFALKPVCQEALYPMFHKHLQDQIAKEKQSTALISLVKSFLKELSRGRELKRVYCIVDGLMNLFQSGQRDKQSQNEITCKFHSVSQVLELSQVLVEFLSLHLSKGSFSGIIAASLDTVMQLDLGIALSAVLINGTLKSESNPNAFEALVRSDQVDLSVKEKLFTDLIKWIILNYQGTKSKSSPAGTRIFTLSMNIETLLGKASVSDQVVSTSLPILMKSILQADFKLRDLITQSKTGLAIPAAINFERALQIQKTVNTLFLNFFKQWVQTDAVAKKFLTELNGFDFLLDRLFSKVEGSTNTQGLQAPSLAKEENKKDEGEKPSTSAPVDSMVGLDEYLFGSNIEGNSGAESQDEMLDGPEPFMNLALQKISSIKTSVAGGKQEKANDLKFNKAFQKAQQKHQGSSKAQGFGDLFAEPEDQDGQKKEEKKPTEAEKPIDFTKEVESKVTLDDWAKNLQLIWTSDKQNSAKLSYQTVQWGKFKNGTKNRVYNYQMTDQQYHYEYVMKFDVQQVIMLNEFQIGVVYNWSTYDPDCNQEPLSLVLEGSKEMEGTPEWRVLLEPVQDDGFRMNSITVYGYNFMLQPKTEGLSTSVLTLNQCIESIGCKEARYFTLRFRKPVLACMDQSLYLTQVSKNKAYGISFVSVMGNQIPEAKHMFSYLLDIQKENSLEVLSKFFSNEFTEAFELISEQESIIEKIKGAFDKLAILMNTKASLIKPIFLAICSKNQSLGDWIMENRLISMDPAFVRKEQISFLGDILSSNKATQIEKLVKLKTFILTQINQAVVKKGSLNEDQKTLLKRYLKLYNIKLRELAFHMVSSKQVPDQQSPESIALEFTLTDLDNVIALMGECSQNAKLFSALTEFALILLIPPKPMVNKTIQVNDYVEKLLSGEKENETQNLLFCSIMASTEENAIQNILKQNKIEQVLAKLKILAADPSAATQDFFKCGQILYNCSKQRVFREKYRSTLPLELYNILRDEGSEIKLLRANLAKSEDAVSLFVSTIRDSILGGTAELELFSSLLKADIGVASEKGDVEFINKVIVPILHAEEKVPITLSAVDEQSLKKGDSALSPIFASSDGAQSGHDSFFLQTTILNKKQKGTFGRMFKELAQDKVENFQKLTDSKWELVFEDKAHVNQNPAKFKTFVKGVNNRANVIIFVQCKVQEQLVVFGGFTNKNFPALGESWAHEFDYQIPYSEANFVCYYTPEKELHYTMTHNKAFGYIYTDYEEGGALSISGDFFLISWSYEFQNSCGNVYDMKCIEEGSNMSFYSNMEIQHIEVWACDPQTKAAVCEGQLKGELKKHPLYKSLSPFNFFRQNIVFEVSKNMTLSQVAQEILGRSQIFIKYPLDEAIANTTTVNDLLQAAPHGDHILDLVFKKASPKPEGSDQGEGKLLTPPPPKEESGSVPETISHDQPLLKLFEEKGGIFDLIKAAKAAVKLYKAEKLREMWSLWLSEIESFSQLPSFFQTFCQDRTKEVILYNLIEGKYDFSDDQSSKPSSELSGLLHEQEELHIEMVKYSYKIVSTVFENHESAELRDQCLSNGTFERFIERIGQLSSEKRRHRVDLSAKKQEVEELAAAKKAEQEDEASAGGKGMMKKKKNKKDDKKDVKRKGVGYTTGVGTAWNVSEYLKSKEAKSSQAANIVNILKHMIKSKDWVAPPEIKQMLLESALLPTLEAAFRSGSLLDMAKEYELNMAYLGFVQEIAGHSSLIDLVQDIGEEYEPRQKEPVYKLLAKLNDLSVIFLSCLTEESQSNMNEEQKKPRNLAERIQATNKFVQEKVSLSQSHSKAQESLADILGLPLSEAYWKLLAHERFAYMAMKSPGGSYNHVYSGELHKGLNPPVSKLVRLAQEIADLSNSLPCDYTNAIFCRVDKERVDVMKCIIMGASGTPYAHGAFVYDLFFENSYPNSPPKCQLVTTGGNTVRFNPNLYNNGKVCLSLLGTWRGQSTENWDPKLSTILQVLLSIQAIIMSNEVYFNEPGYEHEAGTPDGERKNEAYANIVRYCNVKFAIIDAIKNPPAGYEKIIRSNFYLKKNEVLREVKEWVDKAKTSDALYTGLVYDHNYTWAPQISPEGKYAEMMEAIYKELKETLESLPSPFEDSVTGEKVERKFSKNEDDLEDHKESGAASKLEGGTIAKIEDIDVSYDPMAEQTSQAQISIDDDKVKDRWSRYIGAMGIEAVAKQAESRILISGMGPLGVEIAKNIVLAGCKELILFDDVQPIYDELSGQFFISQADYDAQQQNYDFTKTRAHFSRDKLQQLNFYVKVTVLPHTTQLANYIKEQGDLKVVVLTDIFQFTQDKMFEINAACRAHKTAMISASQNGLFGRVFNDFGQEFCVLDKDGEELQEVMIKNICFNEAKGITEVTLLEGFKHRFEDGDKVSIREVLGMNNLSEIGLSINGKVVTIKAINPQSFSIDLDAREFSQYEGNGIAKQVKVPKILNFKTLEELENEPENEAQDSNMMISDFEKLDNKRYLHYTYRALLKILSHQEGALDAEDPFEACKEVLKVVKEIIPKDLVADDKQEKKLANFVYIFTLIQRYSFPPIAAFLGGIVSQEVVKAITQKFTPIQQAFYFDCIELYPEQDVLSLNEEERAELIAGHDSYNDRYLGIKQCLGQDLFDCVRFCKLFMIGAGAIGCELLKNYAMLGLGTGQGGQIVLTDPDVIEVSNLNRQFLFREKHLRKPKSQTAAAAAVQMNPHLKNHISARLDKIHDGTAHIYNEEFFQNQTIVTNALDNVQARLYIDAKCVAARTPLIDSGTLGPKGHVQIVVPELLTESYGSQRDPDDAAGEIPHCTLKMFPEETLHCVEWAKDLFGTLFTLAPQSYNKLVLNERDKPVNFGDQQEKAALKKVIKIAQKRPQSFDDCLRMARLRFQKHFVNDILQLLHVYPLDKTTKEGRPFWSLPKRPPRAVDFDPANPTHANAVSSFACLQAKLYGISLPFEQPRSKESRFEMASQASKIEVPQFVPNDQKASQIESAVDKEKSAKTNDNAEAAQEEEESSLMSQAQPDEIEELRKNFEAVIAPLRSNKDAKPLSVEEFEKDVDENFHVDFIHAMANVRAENYKLDEMDWITVKIKAGRIVPALATTTAAIAALQTIELLKYLKESKIEEHRNSFLNLAVPSLMQSEPGLAEKTKLREDLEVTLWDRWEYNSDSRAVTLLKVVEYLEQKYKLAARDVFFGSVPLFMHALHQGKDRKAVLDKEPLLSQVYPTKSEEERLAIAHIDLTVTFAEDKPDNDKVLEGVPPVRVNLPLK